MKNSEHFNMTFANMLDLYSYCGVSYDLVVFSLMHNTSSSVNIDNFHLTNIKKIHIEYNMYNTCKS